VSEQGIVARMGCCGIYTCLREVDKCGEGWKGMQIRGPVVVLSHATEHGQEPE